MMIPRTLKEIAPLLGAVAPQDTTINGVCVDSRNVVAGNLFVALPGARVDGHSYLEEVASKGAVAALVKVGYSGPDFGLTLLRVPNVMEALQNWAKLTLAATHMKVVAVTGSVGKTTTKEFLSTILGCCHRVAASPGNSNSQIGLPLTILNHVKGDEDILVLEMGMTHPGNITKLVNIAPPDVVLINTVALVHAGNFDSIDEIGRAKGEILSHPKTLVGVIHREIANFDELMKTGTCRKVSFSTILTDVDFRLEDTPQGILVYEQGRKHLIGQMQTPGRHNLHNLLAAIAVARQLDVSWESIAFAVPQLYLPERRLQRVEAKGILFINDSYNAPPIGVKAALASLPTPVRGARRVAVLGPMPELGKFSVECHADVGQYALQHVDDMYCLGDECAPIEALWKQAGRTVQRFSDREELIKTLRDALRPGDVVLVKGANVRQMWKIVEAFQ